MSVTENHLNLGRLAEAIAQRVGQQRFHVWFNNSTKLDLKQDELEIAVPNDFISEWIGKNFSRPIQEAAHEVLGCDLQVRFSIAPELFEGDHAGNEGNGAVRRSGVVAIAPQPGLTTAGAVIPPPESPATAKSPLMSINRSKPESRVEAAQPSPSRPKLRHELDNFVVGPSNQLAYNAAVYVAEFPGSQYNPLFIHGDCGLGKTHLLQGLCKKFVQHHPMRRWLYITGEEFTNDFVGAVRTNKIDAFRRKMRDLDLLVIDDVHFLSGKKATQEEFLHTFNAIEAMGKQVVMASDSHPKLIHEFGESLVNRFVSGMVVRVDPPNYQTRCQILRALSDSKRLSLGDEVITWMARRVTQSVRELEGAVKQMEAQIHLTGRLPDLSMAQESLGDLDRNHVVPISPENMLQAVCVYFGLEHKDLMSGRRQRTISLARSVAMFLVRKTARLSFPEIGSRMGKRNHSTVISACKRIERALKNNERLSWTSSVGEREEEPSELLARLEDNARAL